MNVPKNSLQNVEEKTRLYGLLKGVEDRIMAKEILDWAAEGRRRKGRLNEK